LLLLAAASVSAAILTGATGSHDPSRMINCNGTYYMYSTGGGMKYSTDRLHWSSGASPLARGTPASVRNVIPSTRGIWAPDVIFYNNKYYLYYSVASSGPSNNAIGLITSPTLNPSAPDYKWTDMGMVAIHFNKADHKAAIDPCPFIDASNHLWMSWGSGYGDGTSSSDPNIFITRLDDTTGLASATDTNDYPVALGHIEGSFVYYHNGYYYLFWNSGGCCNGARSSYTIHMARSRNVTGPYMDRNGVVNSAATIFLASTVLKNGINGNEHGPGQLGIISENGIDRCTYHYYPDNGRSVIGMETIIWGADGWPACAADLAPGTYQISSANSGLVLGVSQAGTNNGTPLDLETATGSPSQQWLVDYTTNGPAADGYYRLTSVSSGLVIGVAQSGTDHGTRIDQQTWENGNHQCWLIEQTSDGSYRIVSKASPGAIDASNASGTSGPGLETKDWNNTPNQHWKFSPASGTPTAR
jgi:beta-xylosidase